MRLLEKMPERRRTTNAEYEELLRKADLQLRLKFGPLTKPCADDISDAMDAPMRRIMALPAITPAGLAVKTVALDTLAPISMTKTTMMRIGTT
jgi:hypothetical protein